MAVAKVVAICSTTPITPGTKKFGLRMANDAKGLRVDKFIDQAAAFHGAVFIENDCGHVLHIIVEGISESDHFDERREKHEKQRHRVTQHDDEFLIKNGGITAERLF